MTSGAASVRNGRTCAAIAVLALTMSPASVALAHDTADHAGHGKAMAGQAANEAEPGHDATEHSSHADDSGHADHSSHLKAMAEQTTKEAEPAQVKLLDLPVVDVEGRSRDFKSEVIKDRIVAINFIYTSCTTVCPILSGIFTVVQDRLDGRLGSDVGLVSLSIDPATDVPPRLKRYAQKFEAGPGWTFLTGEKNRMAQVLAGLGAYTPEFEEHPSMILIGDARRNVWHRLYGFPSPEDIVGELERLVTWRQDHQGS